MRKAQRHLLIKQVIEEFPIRTQEELLNKLGHYGVTATQATISRDIRDLKIVKAPETRTEEEDRLVQMIEDIVLKVERVHFLTIVNTLPDNAHLFASVLDEIKPPSIVSTIAGFDTIMVISENEEDAKRVEEFLHHPTEVSLF